MYIYSYVHIWRAARNVKKTPANIYVQQCSNENPAAFRPVNRLAHVLNNLQL